MRRYVRFVVLPLVVLTAVVSACSSDNNKTSPPTAVSVAETTAESAATPTTTAASKPQEFTVMVDGKVDGFNGAFFSYFPNELSVHPGDTIVYKSVFSGEPHSIAFGTVISDAVEGYLKLTPEQQSGQTPPPPDLDAKFALIPSMLPDGPGDAAQTSVNPCFVASGETIPTDASKQCPVTTPAPFDGTETFYNSGFLPDNQSFGLKLADDIKPGIYVGMCTLHFTEMISQVTVVPLDQSIPSPADVVAEGQQQLEDLAAKILPAFTAAKAATTPNHIVGGVQSETVQHVLVAEFVPKDIEVHTNEPVTWTFNGPHSVSFNAPEDARTLLSKGDDGGFHLSPTALAPAGFTPPDTGPPPTGPPSDAPPPPVDAGKWDGTGFFSSGFMFGGDFGLTFTQPGTYKYICLIHPNMEGTVTVTPVP